MKHRMAVLALALLVIASAFAGSEEPLVTIKPEKPAVGAEITILYNPTVKGATLFGVEAVEVQVLVLREKEMPLLLEATMKKAGKVWERSSSWMTLRAGVGWCALFLPKSSMPTRIATGIF